MRAAMRRMLSSRYTVASLIVLALVIVLCGLGPYVSPNAQATQDLDRNIGSISSAHWFGTDLLGRDMLTRVLSGGRISLFVGIVATLVATIIGVIYGMVSGWCGGRIDAVMMRFVDILYAFPFLPFVLLLMAMFGRQFWLIFVAIGAVEWLTMARVVRGQVLALKKQEFITAAQAYGASQFMILRQHLLPNVLGVVIVYASLTMPGVMILEATLSFLGLGVQPPNASWGSLIREGADAIQAYPWLLLGPALFFSITLLALNAVGDALRDALDPKSTPGL
jgi:oligopeptide transport system permease protein